MTQAQGTPNKDDEQHIVVDIETLGTSANAVIASIGAVRITRRPWVSDLEPCLWAVHGEPFHVLLDLDQPGRVMDGATVTWWFQQEAEAQMEIVGPNVSKPYDRVNIIHGVGDLRRWIENFPNMRTTAGVWSMPDFDAALLQNVASTYRVDPCWPFWLNRDIRTAKMACPEAAGADIIGNTTITRHRSDHEAQIVCAYLNLIDRLKGGV